MGKSLRSVRCRSRRFALCALLAVGRPLLADAPPTGTESPAVPPGRKSVLILNVEQPHLPWVAGLTAGIFSAFEGEPPERRPDVHTDYLESVRLPDRAGAESIWFRERYRGQHLDA